MSAAYSIAVALTRAWTELYTGQLPPDVGDARRREIDGDLWDMQHDPGAAHGARGAWLVIARLVAGMLDDVAWRMEQGPLAEQLIVRRVVAVTAATAIVIALWSVPVLVASGRSQVKDCAQSAPAPQTAADYRLEVVRCAGAFFTSVPARR